MQGVKFVFDMPSHTPPQQELVQAMETVSQHSWLGFIEGSSSFMANQNEFPDIGSLLPTAVHHLKESG